jgi:hypothetical protein
MESAFGPPVLPLLYKNIIAGPATSLSKYNMLQCIPKCRVYREKLSYHKDRRGELLGQDNSLRKINLCLYFSGTPEVFHAIYRHCATRRLID